MAMELMTAACAAAPSSPGVAPDMRRLREREDKGKIEKIS
jgi:hypothetical protein